MLNVRAKRTNGSESPRMLRSENLEMERSSVLNHGDGLAGEQHYAPISKEDGGEDGGSGTFKYAETIESRPTGSVSEVLRTKVDPIVGKLLSWAFAFLLLLFLFFIVLGILFSAVKYGLNADCQEVSSCDSPLNSILGVSGTVFGYSNCNGDTVTQEDYYVTVDVGNGKMASVYTGMKWQCVEYARRYWVMEGSPAATFGSVDGAADIWNLETVTLLSDNSTVELLRFENGESSTKPRVKDLVIYKREDNDDFPYGHVAVILGISTDVVYIGEQNWDGNQWPGQYHNYSRQLPLLYNETTSAYTINETIGQLQGWVRYE